jgi:Cys-rich protein (TIGR01571 family)
MSSSQYAPVARDDGIDSNDVALSETLVGNVEASTLTPASSTAMMQVTAPAALPEGYEFDAALGDRIVKVQVPVGGVEAGQTFSVPMPTSITSFISTIPVPVGHWRDSLWSLFSYGACHPHVWTSCCCTTVAAAQVISRLQLTWKGKHGTVAETTGAFQIIFTAVVVYYVLYYSLSMLLFNLDPNSGNEDTNDRQPLPAGAMVVASTIDLMHYTAYGVLVLLLRNLRVTVREKYAIPARDYEDCTCSVFCPCLVAAQMLRHTTDYDAYPATCCTKRGIPEHAPSIV